MFILQYFSHFQDFCKHDLNWLIIFEQLFQASSKFIRSDTNWKRRCEAVVQQRHDTRSHWDALHECDTQHERHVTDPGQVVVGDGQRTERQIARDSRQVAAVGHEACLAVGIPIATAETRRRIRIGNSDGGQEPQDSGWYRHGVVVRALSHNKQRSVVKMFLSARCSYYHRPYYIILLLEPLGRISSSLTGVCLLGRRWSNDCLTVVAWLFGDFFQHGSSCGSGDISGSSDGDNSCHKGDSFVSESGGIMVGRDSSGIREVIVVVVVVVLMMVVMIVVVVVVDQASTVTQLVIKFLMFLLKLCLTVRLSNDCSAVRRWSHH